MMISVPQKCRSQQVLPPTFGANNIEKKGSRLAGLLFLGLASASLSGCVTSVPVDEYTLARAAYDSAKDAEALRYAPALWYNAEQAYREGQRAYRERNYGEAKSDFIDARAAAEKAENAARIARHASGDM